MSNIVKIKNILMEEGALSSFIRNSLANEIDNEWADRPAVFSAHFDWECTEEGFEYWCDILNKLQDENLNWLAFDARDLMSLTKIKGLK